MKRLYTEEGRMKTIYENEGVRVQSASVCYLCGGREEGVEGYRDYYNYERLHWGT